MKWLETKSQSGVAQNLSMAVENQSQVTYSRCGEVFQAQPDQEGVLFWTKVNHVEDVRWEM